MHIGKVHWTHGQDTGAEVLGALLATDKPLNQKRVELRETPVSEELVVWIGHVRTWHYLPIDRLEAANDILRRHTLGWI